MIRVIDSTNVNEVTVNNRYAIVDGVNRVKVLSCNNSAGYIDMTNLHFVDGYNSYLEIIESFLTEGLYTIIEFTTTDELKKFIESVGK